MLGQISAVASIPSPASDRLRIDPPHRPDGRADVATYHPTFLYEALWNLALAAVLVWAGRYPRPGQLFAGDVAGYAAGRSWVESLRIDPATELLVVRVSLWVSAAVFVTAVMVLVIRHRRTRDGSELEDDGAAMVR